MPGERGRIPFAPLGAQDMRAFRALFPALRGRCYLSICDKMILADPVRAAVERFLDHLAAASAVRTDHERLVQSSRQKFARLVNAREDEIAVTRNVSDGMNAIAGAFPFRTGDNVVLCKESEHPNNIYPWLRLRPLGIEVRTLRGEHGRIDTGRLMEATDSRTRLIAVASVTFCPGERTDLEHLGEVCRRKGIFLAVDGVQSAGILHHDLGLEPVDAFATSTSKGLLGLYGYGFLYVRRKWIEHLQPSFLSRSSVEAADDSASSMGAETCRLQADARRFELGSHNLAGAYAADAALDLLLGLGTRRIESHVLQLAEDLRQRLAELDLPVHWPRHPQNAAHIVTCGQVDAGGHGYSSDPRITHLHERLAAEGVVSTIRRGQLRFGLHGFNSSDDVALVSEACATHCHLPN